MIKLYQFPHSHFSEKARWALGFKALPFEIINLPRGKHAKILAGFGLRETSVPVIRDGDTVLQGSSAILSYLDEKYPAIPLMPEDPDTRRDILEFETYLDTAVGHHGRRYIYSSLLKHPALIKQLFMGGANPLMRMAFPILFPKIRTLLIKKLEITDQAPAESRQIVEEAFARLDQRLDGRDFLFADRMTRADITAAALSAIFTWPPEHEFDFGAQGALPDDVEAFKASLADQRFFGWGRDLYRTSRHKTGAEINSCASTNFG